MDTIKSGDELLDYKLRERVTPASFSDSINIILIHGFTASSDYMLNLACYLDRLGMNVLLFNYNSYKGIDRAAQSMFDILESLEEISDKNISKKKIFIVAHSMGGLVARSLCQFHEGGKYIVGIFTIGTPHNGSLAESKYISGFVKYYESIAGPGAQKGYRIDCRSMLQLTRKDSDDFLLKLDETNHKLKGIKLGSISGGKRFLELSKNNTLAATFINKFFNRHLQECLGSDDNDGLVTEASSDWSKNIKNSEIVSVEHLKNYSEYKQLNHSYLITNQSVGLRVAAFVKGV